MKDISRLCHGARSLVSNQGRRRCHNDYFPRCWVAQDIPCRYNCRSVANAYENTIWELENDRPLLPTCFRCTGRGVNLFLRTPELDVRYVTQKVFDE